ncbi:PAS domain S-box protein [Pengzhenrongella sp.]|uniref:sensor histidine kinase n=1 Tax=Pengzhenrongella sp. TaxID=2888820 RepID=UPI002F9409BA
MKFESLLEAAPDAMVGVDSTGTIRFVNRQTESLFGYSRGELVGESIETLVPESFRAVHPANRTGYFADPRTRAMGAGLNLSGRRRDGSEFPVDISLSSIETEDGLLVTAAVRDITERKKIEAKFESLLEAAPDAMVGVDSTGTIRFVNRQTESLFGYSRGELVGESIEMLVPESFRAVHPANRTRYFADPRTRAMGAGLNLSGRRRDGSEFPVDMSLSSVETEDGLLVTAAVRDITERKKIEARVEQLDQRTTKLDEAIEQLESFSYSVSHDLRAPLRAIDGFSRIVLEEYGDRLDAEGLRLLNVIRRATTEMARLIDDLLAFSRVGRHPIERQEIDPAKVFTSVIRELAPTYAERDLAVVIGSLPTIHGDNALIRQVFVNLVSNAIKFTAPREHARIDIGGDVEDDRKIIWVKDNGVGFDKAYEEKMFQVFQRLHPAEFEGTGVGLAIVQRIVRRHGGQVWADGSVGQGATVYVAFPSANEELTDA